MKTTYQEQPQAALEQPIIVHRKFDRDVVQLERVGVVGQRSHLRVDKGYPSARIDWARRQPLADVRLVGLDLFYVASALFRRNQPSPYAVD